jgi:hypothetical protein
MKLLRQQSGQVMPLSVDEAIPLIEDGTATPLGKVAYKICSAFLGCCLWLVECESDVRLMRANGVEEVIDTASELEVEGKGQSLAETCQRGEHSSRKPQAESIHERSSN